MIDYFFQGIRKLLLISLYLELSIQQSATFQTKKTMDNYDDDQNVDNYDEDEVHTLTYSCIMAPNRCTKRCLNISDSIIAIAIVTPLVVGHW